MSARHAVRSLGQPYFALVQNELSGMNEMARGFACAYQWVVTVAFHELPVKNASDDENHAFASLHPFGPTTDLTFEIGVTPNGALVVTAPGGSWRSQNGVVVASTAYRVVNVTYSAAAGTCVAYIDTELLNMVPTGSPLGDLTDGTLYMFTLLNGRYDLTRMRCAMRAAQLYVIPDLDPGNLLLFSWDLAEGAGSTTAGMLTGTMTNPPDLTLTAQFYQAYVADSRPWGEVPFDSAVGAYLWELITDYTDRELPETVYVDRD